MDDQNDSTESILKEIFLKLAEKEKEIEKYRHRISNNIEYDPAEILVFLDINQKEKIDYKDLISYLGNFRGIEIPEFNAQLIILFYDRNEDGALDKEEFISLLQNDNFVRKNEIFHLKKDKKNFSSKIDYFLTSLLEKENELAGQIIFLLGKIQNQPDFDIHKIYHFIKIYDYIDKISLKQFFKKVRVECSDQDIFRIIKRLDFNKDGQIDLVEFYKFFGYPNLNFSDDEDLLCKECIFRYKSKKNDNEYQVKSQRQPDYKFPAYYEKKQDENKNTKKIFYGKEGGIESIRTPKTSAQTYEQNPVLTKVSDNHSLTFSLERRHFLESHRCQGCCCSPCRCCSFCHFFPCRCENFSCQLYRSTQSKCCERYQSSSCQCTNDYQDDEQCGLCDICCCNPCQCCPICHCFQCKCCSICHYFPCCCCHTCHDYPCKCCLRCKSFPCKCCPICHLPECHCCFTCQTYPCKCCKKCRFEKCRCCEGCHSYPCKCCSICHSSPCKCCPVCNCLPCRCCKKCPHYIGSPSHRTSLNPNDSSNFNNNPQSGKGSINPIEHFSPHSHKEHEEFCPECNPCSYHKHYYLSCDSPVPIRGKPLVVPPDQEYVDIFKMKKPKARFSAGSPCKEEESLFIDFLQKMMLVESQLEKEKIYLAEREDFNMEDAFRIFERNNKEFLTREDLIYGLKILGLEPTKLEISLLLKRFDLKDNGQLSYSDFFDMLAPFDEKWKTIIENREPKSCCSNSAPNIFSCETLYIFVNLLKLIITYEKNLNEMRKDFDSLLSKFDDVFGILDYMKQGFFTHSDLKHYVKRHNIFLTDNDFDLLYIRLDRNRNGEIDFGEIKSDLTPVK